MANSLTNLGEQYALLGNSSPTPTDGGIARLTTNVRLYDSTSVPIKAGTGFVEVANLNGYLTGGHAITFANWTFSVVSLDGQVQLADQLWTATTGNIANILGAYITDTGGNVLAWWARASAVTLLPGDKLTLDDLTIRLT